MTETFRNGIWSRKPNGQCSPEGIDSIPPHEYLTLVDVAASAVMTILGFARTYPIEKVEQLAERLEVALGCISDETSPELTAIARHIHAKALVLIVMQNMLAAEFLKLSKTPDKSDKALRYLTSEFDAEWRSKRAELLNLQEHLHKAIPKEIRPYVQEILSNKNEPELNATGLEH